jgi:hypothetical protein
VFHVPNEISVAEDVDWGVVNQLKVIEGEYKVGSEDVCTVQGRD